MLQVLKHGDGRRRGLIADWDEWLGHADHLYMRFLDRVGESPFTYHEVAATGFLASAAALAGFIPLAEYEITKRGKLDRRTRALGRADLWFASPQRAYSFEVKRAWLAATPANLRERLTAAADDIGCIPEDEYHYGAGLLITKVRDAHRRPTYELLAQDEAVDLAYRIGPDGEEGAYLYFKLAC
jgi:hypothetical protein